MNIFLSFFQGVFGLHCMPRFVKTVK